MNMNMLVVENCCPFSAATCIFLTVSYVSSLYVWRTNYARDHPSTIKRRFFSVFCIMLFAPYVTLYVLKEDVFKKGDIYEQLGLRAPGFFNATILPLILTVILFFGPLTMLYFSGILKLYTEPVYWLSRVQDLTWVRNHLMAPLSEEWVFRSCMMPLLLQYLRPLAAIFLGPLLFGVAHLHHVHELMKAGFLFRMALMVSTLQFTFTTLFGAYSAFLFLRTGHFVAPLMAHVFCNHMGFPNFSDVFEFPLHQRRIIIINFLIGLALWCYLLMPMTNPDIYDNKLYSVT